MTSPSTKEGIRALRSLVGLWDAAPWQAPFHADARGHALAVRIGRLLEPNLPKEQKMKRLVAMAAVLAVLAVGAVRVELVAQEQDVVSPEDAGGVPPIDSDSGRETVGPEADDEASSGAPAALPTSAEKQRLRYDGKTFNEWRAVLDVELKAERRAEAMAAIAAFAPQGYGEETAVILFAEMTAFDERRLSDGRMQVLADGIVAAMRDVDPAITGPLLVKAIQNGPYGARYLCLRCVRPGDKSDELYQAVVEVVKDDAQISRQRTAALEALDRIDRRYLKSGPIVRDAILSPKATQQMAEVVEGRIFRDGAGESDEFLDQYAREFAVPVLLATATRWDMQQAIRDHWTLLHRAPDQSFEQLFSMANEALTRPSPNTQARMQAYAHLESNWSWTLTQLVKRYPDVPSELRTSYLNWIQNAVNRSRRDAVVAGNEELLVSTVKLLGQVVEQGDAELSPIAELTLQALASSGRAFRRETTDSGPVLDAAREELTRLGKPVFTDPRERLLQQLQQGSGGAPRRGGRPADSSDERTESPQSEQ